MSLLIVIYCAIWLVLWAISFKNIDKDPVLTALDCLKWPWVGIKNLL